MSLIKFISKTNIHLRCRIPFFILVLLCISKYDVIAQITRFDTIVNTNIVATDRYTILPSSVSIVINDSIYVENKTYSIDNNQISITDSLVSLYEGAKLTVSYRTFSFDFAKTYLHLDSTIMDTLNKNVPIGYKTSKTSRNIIESTDLDYNGTFSRGFTVGNTQSLTLNSNFDLQLSGDLGYGLTVAAAISDDNIPIQPEGNTQLLQEFDKVFIKVKKDKTSILAGDFQLQKPKGYFTKYQKKLKGLSVETEINAGKTTITSNGSIAVARGKFSRQNLSTSEGNQGPYKLRGNDGERFLIVLSGTERVYLDDRLLKRGFNYDYTIDYNRAEVVFSPNILIRNESRIIVEFEYTDQNYLRTLYSSNSYFNNEKWSAHINIYNEQDSKNATGDIVLDSIDLHQLALSGDNFAYKDGIFEVTDTNNLSSLITYTKIPNNNPLDTASFILVYSDDSSLELVQASFTELGEYEGTYTIDNQSTARSRVYKYVGPGAGNYIPNIKLTPPEKRQMISLGGAYEFVKEGTLSGELSYSNYDNNRFSTIQNDNNKGLAGMIKYAQNIKLDSVWNLTTELLYEVVQKNFTPVNPYRNPEFLRDWNVVSLETSNSQELINGNVNLIKSDILDITYGLSNYHIIDQFKGTKHRLDSKIDLPSQTKFDIYSSILNSESVDEVTTFKRLKSKIDQTVFKKSGLTIGIATDIENNKRWLLSDLDKLQNRSRGYERYDSYIQNSNTNKYFFKLGYSHRIDRAVAINNLVPSIRTEEFSLSSVFNFSPRHNFRLKATHRNFDVVENGPLDEELADKKTLVGKVDYNLNLLNSFLVTNTSYTIQSGQQPKIEYSFEKVPEGQGDYIYIGNEDSTLVNLNFRYNPNIGTANYIRIPLVNGEFLTTNNQLISQSLRLSPKRIWKSKLPKLKKWKQILSRLSTLSTIQIDKRSLAENGVQYFNFQRDSNGLVQYNGLIVNTLFINKGQQIFDSQISHRSSSNIVTQIAGLETRTNDVYSLNARLGIGRNSDLLFEAVKGNRRYSSQFFPERDFNIEQYRISPKISVRPTDKFRIALDYIYDQRNELLNPEKLTAKSNEFAIDINYSDPSKLAFQTRFSLVDVDYNGSPDSPIEYDILQGLKDGKNYIWSSRFTKRLNTNLDVIFSYEGRKTGSIPIVHIARAQVKATF